MIPLIVTIYRKRLFSLIGSVSETRSPPPPSFCARGQNKVNMFTFRPLDPHRPALSPQILRDNTMNNIHGLSTNEIPFQRHSRRTVIFRHAVQCYHKLCFYGEIRIPVMAPYSILRNLGIFRLHPRCVQVFYHSSPPLGSIHALYGEILASELTPAEHEFSGCA